jgi:spermidine synthase
VPIAINIREERGVRYLHFGSEWVQGAMRIARPASLELEYTRELMLPLLLRRSTWPASVLQIGLGSASITRFLYRHRPKARLTIVEIAPEIVAAARQFFKLPEDAKRVRIRIGEGAEYVATRDESFDLIVADGFDDRGRTGMLETLAFYVNCRARLSASGILAVNLVDRRKGSVAASGARLGQAFDGRVLVLPPCADGNTIAIAFAGDDAEVTREVLREGAARLRADTGLDLRPTLARLAVKIR